MRNVSRLSRMSRKPNGVAVMNGHASIPIVPQDKVELSPAERERLASLAARLLRDEPALNAVRPFGEGVTSGLTDAPGLFYEDHSEISLYTPEPDSPLEYRSLLLAGSDDVVLLGGRRHPAFESYCREILDLGTVTVLQAKEEDRFPNNRPYRPLAERALSTPEVLARLCDTCTRNGGFNVIPYIGKGTAWKLAGAVAGHTGKPVHVAAPPPRLTRRVNDKIWFAQRVTEVFDRESLPPSFSAFGPAALASRIAALAARYPQVVVKVPDSAGSLGNIVLRSTDVAPLSLASLRRWLLDTLKERGWQNTYPLMVGVWEEAVLSSPSVNLWIPNARQGPPVIEAIFSQTLKGVEGRFVGAEPSDLPSTLRKRLAYEAMQLGYLFQLLGYFGRCGFDAVLVGESLENPKIHWIECNGRWGGVSTPVTLANRLTGDWSSEGLIVVQQSEIRLQPRPFESTLALLDDLLLKRPQKTDGIVLLTPGRLVSGSGMNFMALGKSAEEAQTAATNAITRLVAPESHPSEPI